MPPAVARINSPLSGIYPAAMVVSIGHGMVSGEGRATPSKETMEEEEATWHFVSFFFSPKAMGNHGFVESSEGKNQSVNRFESYRPHLNPVSHEQTRQSFQSIWQQRAKIPSAKPIQKLRNDCTCTRLLHPDPTKPQPAIHRIAPASFGCCWFHAMRMGFLFVPPPPPPVLTPLLKKSRNAIPLVLIF